MASNEFQPKLEWFESIPSTSALLLERAGKSNFHGTVISAHHQTSGRGRRGRTWETGSGNLAFSIGFAVPEADAKFLAYFPLAAGIAVHKAIAEVLDAEAEKDLNLKWPNDLAWRGKKLMGLLSQARTSDGVTYLSIGIGINIAWAPENLPAISLYSMPLRKNFAVERPSKEEVLNSLLEKISADYSKWRGFDFLRREWESRAHYLGKRIFFGLLEDEAGMEEGIALGLDVSGALRVRLPGGETRLLATEDLSLRLG
jgi:BirA family biotin operon repressor/biotin-[acetyl-CoA-carboxylase] ligase